MVTVRFAPSPTGRLHLGSVRTAVFNWLTARHSSGKMILRIEDTDLSRSKASYTRSILKDMRWMGMDFDEFYKQSERFPIYRKYLDALIERGDAYYCTCSREDLEARVAKGEDEVVGVRYDGHCRGNTVKPKGSYVVRLNIGPDRTIEFNDLVKKKVAVDTRELDDFVIMKSDGSPTYNFAVVIDDALMEMTHVVRGEDHITNTAKQIIVYEKLGFAVPQFAHLPLVLDKDKTPLSKRKGSTNIEYYRKEGILPEALLNSIARLGWSSGNDEVFSVPELIERFDINKVNRSNAVYDEEKMIWINGRHMRMQKPEVLLGHFEEFLDENDFKKSGKMKNKPWLLMALNILKVRHNTLKALYDELLVYSETDVLPDPAALDILGNLLKKNLNLEKAFYDAKNMLLGFRDVHKVENLEEKLRDIASENFTKFGELVSVLRIKLTGRNSSPDIVSVIRMLSKDLKKRL